MKRFNIAKSHFLLNDHRMAINEVYGQFVHTDGRKIIYRISNFKEYSKDVSMHKCINDKVVEFTKTYHYYKVMLWNDKEEKWESFHTDYKPLRNLGKFLRLMFVKVGISEATKVIKYVDNSIPNLPYEKKVPKPQYNIDIVGYALNTRIMTSGYNGWKSYNTNKTTTVCNTNNTSKF